MTTFAKIFHSAAVVHFFYGIYYNVNYVVAEELKFRGYSFGGPLVYMTILNFIFLAFYFTISLVNDFVGSNKATNGDRPLIRKVRDFFFGTLGFPITFNVGLMFWLLYAIDRKLVLPKGVTVFFPSWLNHFLHTNIMFFIALEMILLHHKYPSRKYALTFLLTVMVVYMVWIHVIYGYTGRWVYPVLAILSWPQRILFYIFSNILPVTLYFVGQLLNGLIWHDGRLNVEPMSNKRQSKKAKKTKSK